MESEESAGEPDEENSNTESSEEPTNEPDDRAR